MDGNPACEEKHIENQELVSVVKMFGIHQASNFQLCKLGFN